MSDTPRTDAEEFDAYDSPGSGKSACIPNVVEGNFARQLERELATTRQQLLSAQADNKRLRDALSEYVDVVACGNSPTDFTPMVVDAGITARTALSTPLDLSALARHEAGVLEEAASVVEANATCPCNGDRGYCMENDPPRAYAAELRRLAAEKLAGKG